MTTMPPTAPATIAPMDLRFPGREVACPSSKLKYWCEYVKQGNIVEDLRVDGVVK
jgi:hypothetical protein